MGKDNSLYTFCMVKPEKSKRLLVRSLARGNGMSPEKISEVTVLGYDGKLNWKHGADGLEIIFLDMPDVSPAAVTFKINYSNNFYIT